jgi:hypothetical protein
VVRSDDAGDVCGLVFQCKMICCFFILSTRRLKLGHSDFSDFPKALLIKMSTLLQDVQQFDQLEKTVPNYEQS